MQTIRVTLVILAMALVTSCSPYRIDIQQGNLITNNEVSQLKQGMSKRDVRYVLGTPLIVDPFHDNRWDYYYSFEGRKRSQSEQRRITLVFDQDRLQQIEGGDDLPVEAKLSAGGTKVTDQPGKKKKGRIRKTLEKIRTGGDSSE